MNESEKQLFEKRVREAKEYIEDEKDRSEGEAIIAKANQLKKKRKLAPLVGFANGLKSGLDGLMGKKK